MARHLPAVHNPQCSCQSCTDNKLNPTTIAPEAVEQPPRVEPPTSAAVVHQSACGCVECTARKLQPPVASPAVTHTPPPDDGVPAYDRRDGLDEESIQRAVDNALGGEP